MRNHFKTSIQLERIDICDLLLACLVTEMVAQKEESPDDGAKWNRLHAKLKAQLDELDKQLDEI